MEKIPHNDSYFCHVAYYHTGTVICKDSNKDDWIYVIRAGCCRVIKALTQVTPKLTLKKKPEIIYDRFSTQLISPYSMEALGAYRYRAATAKPCTCFTEVEQLCEKSVFLRPYLTENELQNKLQCEVNWTAYKSLLVERIRDRNIKNRALMFKN
ncbi:unnamed protein product [Rotaria magnacalcarata]|nr:unnamed protein product [Rotaria magnacalcarata]CAF5178589.1 unnamed protein product [Rotaria magnacalcarata]